MEGEPHTELRHRVTSDCCCVVKLTIHGRSRVHPQNLLEGEVLLESEMFSSQMAALMWRVTPVRPSSPLKIITSCRWHHGGLLGKVDGRVDVNVLRSMVLQADVENCPNCRVSSSS